MVNVHFRWIEDIGRTGVCLSLLLFCVSCGDSNAQGCEIDSFGKSVKGTGATVRGYYSTGFETSNFIPCDELGEKAWWLQWKNASDAEMLREEIKRLGGGAYTVPGKKVFLRAEACVSGPGHYGHLGVYEKLIEITKVLEFHAGGDADCDAVRQEKGDGN